MRAPSISYPCQPQSTSPIPTSLNDPNTNASPIIKFPYERSKLKEIGMVAGGTGITPMLQVVEWCVCCC